MSPSLYIIEDSLQQLAELRDQAEAEGDSEALKVIEAQIGEYLTKEAAKVDSYAGLIQRETANAKLCREEANRLLELARKREAFVEMLKERAVAVMEQFGVRVIESPKHRMRVQGNGGLEPLEIPMQDRLPEGLKEYTVKMPGDLYHWIWNAIKAVEEGLDLVPHPLAEKVMDEATSLPRNQAIREALKSGEDVPGARLLPRGKSLRIE